jgi:HD-like signal output (HDOD) protein
MPHDSAVALAPAASEQATCRLLVERISDKGDLPGFSAAVAAIRRAMEARNDNHEELIRTILSDPSLTQMVLRLANSAMYSRFGRNIGTVSRAVMVLGQHAIGHLAFGVKLVDSVNALAKGGARETQEQMQGAVQAGQVVRRVLVAIGESREVEEVVVATLLHRLGHILASYYLPELWAELDARGASANVPGSPSQEECEIEVLGMTLQRLGRFMGARWGLPQTLLNTLQNVTPRAVLETPSQSEWVAACATLGNQVERVMQSGRNDANEAIAELAYRFAAMLGVEPDELAIHLVEAAQAARRESTAPAPARRVRETPDVGRDLKKGVADIERAIDSATPSQLLSMAVETAFAACAPANAVLFLRNRRERLYRARFALGQALAGATEKLTFSDEYSADVFHAALTTQRILFIENTRAANSATHLPTWWKVNFPKTIAFLVIPLIANEQPIGVIYVGWLENQPRPHLGHAEIQTLTQMREIVGDAFALKMTSGI